MFVCAGQSVIESAKELARLTKEMHIIPPYVLLFPLFFFQQFL